MIRDTSRTRPLATLPGVIQEVLSVQYPFSYKVCSWCLYPILWKRDQLVLDQRSPEELKRGDVVLFSDGTNLYSHRFLYSQTKDEALILATADEQSYQQEIKNGITLKECRHLYGVVKGVIRRKRRINASQLSEEAIPVYIRFERLLTIGFSRLINFMNPMCHNNREHEGGLARYKI